MSVVEALSAPSQPGCVLNVLRQPSVSCQRFSKVQAEVARRARISWPQALDERGDSACVRESPLFLQAGTLTSVVACSARLPCSEPPPAGRGLSQRPQEHGRRHPPHLALAALQLGADRRHVRLPLPFGQLLRAPQPPPLSRAMILHACADHSLARFPPQPPPLLLRCFEARRRGHILRSVSSSTALKGGRVATGSSAQVARTIGRQGERAAAALPTARWPGRP